MYLLHRTEVYTHAMLVPAEGDGQVPGEQGRVRQRAPARRRRRIFVGRAGGGARHARRHRGLKHVACRTIAVLVMVDMMTHGTPGWRTRGEWTLRGTSGGGWPWSRSG